MEVETSNLSASHNPPSPYRKDNPMMPQRASQVFGFLKERRRSYLSQDVTALIPLVPSAFNLESPFKSRFPDDPNDSPSRDETQLSIPVPYDTHTNRHARASSFNSSRSCLQSSSAQSHTNSIRSQCGTISSDFNLSYNADVLQSHLAPLTHNTDNLKWDIETCQPSLLPIIAPDRSAHITQHKSRIRPVSDSSYDTRGRHEKVADSLTNVLYESRRNVGDAERLPPQRSITLPGEDPFTLIPFRKRKMHRQVLERFPSTLPSGTCYLSYPETGRDKENDGRQRVTDVQAEKENEFSTNADVSAIPMTPFRTHSRTLLKSEQFPSLSSDLSPVAQQLMTDIRQQRLRARERERKGRR